MIITALIIIIVLLLIIVWELLGLLRKPIVPPEPPRPHF